MLSTLAVFKLLSWPGALQAGSIQTVKTGRKDFLERESNETEAESLNKDENVETELFDSDMNQEKA